MWLLKAILVESPTASIKSRQYTHQINLTPNSPSLLPFGFSPGQYWKWAVQFPLSVPQSTRILF